MTWPRVVTAKDADYKKSSLKEVWQQNRVLQGSLLMKVSRVELQGAVPSLGIAGTEQEIEGFPLLGIPVYVKQYTIEEISQSGGLIKLSDRQVSFFAVEFANQIKYVPLMEDRIYLQKERWEIKSLFNNTGIDYIKMTISPVPLKQTEGR